MRPRLSPARTRWLLFAAAALATLVGLGWVTRDVLELDERARNQRIDGFRKQQVQTAVRAMDTVAAELLARESARPHFHYEALVPVDRAYSELGEPLTAGEVFVPSPLLERPDPPFKLHFQVRAGRPPTSPQAPVGRVEALAVDRLGLPAGRIARSATMLEELASIIVPAHLRSQVAEPRVAPGRNGSRGQVGGTRAESTLEDSASDAEVSEPLAESASEPAADDAPGAERSKVRSDADETAEPPDSPRLERPDPGELRLGPLGAQLIPNPRRNRPELVLVRLVATDTAELLQGVWVDWAQLERLLLAEVTAVLPEATLELTGRTDGGERLATLPVSLLPGPPPRFDTTWAPIHTALAVAWVALVAAIAAAGLGLRAALELGERRGRFVSTVTHELRTPLTTFCMYTEMLAGGLVRDEEKRQQYLETLERESRRLRELVENVLTFARVEQGRAAPELARHDARELIAGALPEVEARASAGGMELETTELPEEGLAVVAEPGAVARILYNLVDNACKYATATGDPRLRLEIGRGRRRLFLTVRDFGPGIPRGRRTEIFEPFTRADGAEERPGMGLGLGLARELARQMGGDLRLTEPAEGPGAAFRLELPLA